MKRFAFLLIGVVLLLPSPAVGGAGQTKQPWIGNPAPPFSLPTLDGKRLSLSDLRGQFVVLHFGAGW
jgi:cytochrome oxidase Cu insertion factor (SCO1/SenC/PrrC family)